MGVLALSSFYFVNVWLTCVFILCMAGALELMDVDLDEICGMERAWPLSVALVA